MRNAENAKDKRAAEEASRNLQQAAERMQRNGERSSPANAVQQLADQATRLAEAQRKSEVDIRMALANVAESDNQSRMRRDGLNPNQAKKLADAKSQMLSDLQKLEDQLRNTAQTQRRSAPQTAQRLGEIVDELSSVNVPTRISQTIVDLERGRADQSSLSEGLVTETLQNAASDLRDAARMAGQEVERKAKSVEPDALVAEVGQLRRALQNAQRDANAGRNRNARQSQSGEGSPNGSAQQPSGSQNASQEGAQPGTQQNSPGSQQGGRAGAQSGGGGGRYAYGGPIGNVQAGGWGDQRIGDVDAWRIGNAIRLQLNAIQERIAAGNLTLADLQTLRALTPEIHRISGDALAAQLDLVRSVERLELAALAAAEKARTQVAARSGAPAQDSANEGESVAEYYRRLGK
jgi:hypothetical protein